MVEMFGYDRATGESAVTASEMRQQHLATEIDDSASIDNIQVSSTKSQSQYQPRTKKAKTSYQKKKKKLKD